MVLTRRWRRHAAGLAAAAVLACGSTPAWGTLDVRLQTQYQLFEVKPQGQPAKSSDSLSTSFNIAFRGPLTPYSKLQSFLITNSSDFSDQAGTQWNRNVVFNLLSQERTYRLTGSIERSDFNSAAALIGAPSFSSGHRTNHNINFLWQEESLPTLNLQYRLSNTVSSSLLSRSSYSTATWLTGTFYEFRPFRFTFDGQQQRYDLTGTSSSTHSTTSRSRTGLNFEQRLLNGLDLTMDLSHDSNSTQNAGLRTSLGGTSSVFRLNATPTQSVLMSLERSIFSSHQSGRSFQFDTDSDNTSLSLRADVLPGLSLSLIDAANDQNSGDANSTSRNRSASLGAVLGSETFATIGRSDTTFRSSPGDVTTDQTNSYLSLRTPMGYDSDLNIDLGINDSSSGPAGFGFRGKFAGFMVRNRSRSDMSLGIGYRWDSLNQQGISNGKQNTQTVDFDMSWQPARAVGVNARANYYVTNGSNISQYISPTIDVRWEPSTQSNLTLRYNFNNTRLWDPLFAMVRGQSARGISARLSYRLPSQSSFDISYDFQSASASSIDFQRVLRFFFRMML